MVNFDEILLLVIGSLSLGFLNRNGKDPSVQTVGATREFVNPYLDKLQTAAVTALNQLGTSEKNLENIRLNNLEIGQNILNIERQRADIDIDFIQSNLDESRSYISQQQKTFPAASGFSSLAPQGDWQNAARSLLSRITNTNQGQSVFPDFRLINNQQNYNIVAQQVKYETAQQNIELANQTVLKQINEIQKISDEYENTYGDISRYS